MMMRTAGVRAVRAAAAASAKVGAVNARAMSSMHTPLCMLTEDEQMFKDMVTRFAHDVVAPKCDEMDRTGVMDKDIIKQLFENGLMGIEVDPDFGGSGASFVSMLTMVETMATVDASVSVCADVQNSLVNAYFRLFATRDLQERFLPRLATDTVGAFALSEPGSGSDAFALATRATEQPDGSFKLDGTKCWITNSAYSDVFIVMANVDPSKGYKGITAFVVERGMEGFSVGKDEDKMGLRASSTATLTLEGVHVPRENVLGEIGKGYKYAINTLNEGRVAIAAQAVGIAQGSFDAALDYTRQRSQFGRPIFANQAVQHQLAQAATDIEAARALTYNAGRMKQQGMPFQKEAAMAKLFASQVASRVTALGVDLHGGVGFTRGLPERMYRDSRITSIYEGTSNIQLETIGKCL